MSKKRNPESLLDRLITELPKDFALDLSHMKDIVTLEKKYDEIGTNKLETLLELSKIKITEGERSYFIRGFSECGQDMNGEIEKLKKIVSIQNQMIDIAQGFMPDPDEAYNELKFELEKIK